MNIILRALFMIQLTTIKLVSCDNNPIVTTKLGKIKGVTKQLDDASEVHLYYGIPYGKPPVGGLRFKKPEPVSSWQGIYDATKAKFACIQPPNGFMTIEAPQNEDCLYLSVWKPANNTINGKKRSVMFWIHGGGLEVGTMFSFSFDARIIASVGDVVVVTINYRLNAFGFLYGGTEDAPGNIGFHDQILALKWVKDNIDAFGGDPNSITIFGQSSGAEAVGILILSPLSAGLFRRAIMQSGGPMGVESSASALLKTKSLANQINCNQTLMEEVIKCIREKPAEDILKASIHASENMESFGSIYGDELIPIKPSDALKTGKFNQNLDLLFGSVNDEESSYMAELFSDLAPNKPSNLTVEKAKSYIQAVFSHWKVPYGNLVADFYTSGLTDNDKDQLRRAVSESFGDYITTCPTILFGRSFALWNRANGAYAYRLTHVLQNQLFQECTGWLGVCHGDDNVIIFGFPIRLRGIGFNEIDYKFSLSMINAWSTFAKKGEPPALDNIKWVEAIDRIKPDPPVKYMDLNPARFRIVEDGYKTTCEGFWKPFFDV